MKLNRVLYIGFSIQVFYEPEIIQERLFGMLCDANLGYELSVKTLSYWLQIEMSKIFNLCHILIQFFNMYTTYNLKEHEV